ncbi:MAG: hypothetical protein HUJ42_00350 [Malacoplasma sp.]|nr:hypothetical protein [Malacoplasma sp.]
MAKKKKFSFTDLADEDFVVHKEEQKTSEKSAINFTLQDLKENAQQNNNQTVVQKLEENKSVINSSVVSTVENDAKKNNVTPTVIENVIKKVTIEDKKEVPVSNNTDASNQLKTEQLVVNESPTTTQSNISPKRNYEVNYDDILNDNQDKKTTEIIGNLFKKEDPIKELFSTKSQPETISNSDLESEDNNHNNNNNNNSLKNLKPRSTLVTYNEAIKKQEKLNTESTHFEENKIKQYLTIKEKLDVKTNIYLKSSVVVKLKELEDRTNESRSSIINKLIEIALKNIEN